MDTRLNVAAIMSAMTDYAQRQSEHDKALAEYEECSWDYHGWEYIVAVEEARDHAQKVLDEYIDLKIAQALEEHIRNG